MRTNILITTTNTIENASIVNYIGLVTTNIVIGANLFSDFAASFTDVFGGFSNTYQSKLEKIYHAAIDELKHKALNIGANAIIGVRVDFDEVTGGGKSMFMVSISGTAIKLATVNNIQNKDLNTQTIGYQELQNEISKRNMITLLAENKSPDAEQWEYLLNNGDKDIALPLLERYLKLCNQSDNILSVNARLLCSNITYFFRAMNPNDAIEILYSMIEKNSIAIAEIIEENKLFSPEKVLLLLENNQVNAAILCLSSDKEFYSKEDLKQMILILDHLENLPDIGRIEVSKGLLSKGKEKFICPNGHSNDIANKFCSISDCGLNIKGLDLKDIKAIEAFKLKVDSLRNILNTL